MDKNSEKKFIFLVFFYELIYSPFFFYIWLEIAFKIHFLAKEYLMACSLSDLPNVILKITLREKKCSDLNLISLTSLKLHFQ